MLVQAQRGSGGGRGGIATTHSQPGTIRRWVFSSTLQPLYPRKDPVQIVQEAGWASGPVWTARKISPPTGFRTPDSQACSDLLYRLSYAGR